MTWGVRLCSCRRERRGGHGGAAEPGHAPGDQACRGRRPKEEVDPGGLGGVVATAFRGIVRTEPNATHRRCTRAAFSSSVFQTQNENLFADCVPINSRNPRNPINYSVPPPTPPPPPPSPTACGRQMWRRGASWRSRSPSAATSPGPGTSHFQLNATHKSIWSFFTSFYLKQTRQSVDQKHFPEGCQLSGGYAGFHGSVSLF